MSDTRSKDPFRLVFNFCLAQWRRQRALTAAIAGAMLMATICESVIPLFAGRLVDALGPLIGSTQVLSADRVVAHVSQAGGRLGATTSSSVSMLTWPGVSATRVFVPARHIADQARRTADQADGAVSGQLEAAALRWGLPLVDIADLRAWL